jgi:hypothetical protein
MTQYHLYAHSSILIIQAHLVREYDQQSMSTARELHCHTVHNDCKRAMNQFIIIVGASLVTIELINKVDLWQSYSASLIVL